MAEYIDREKAIDKIIECVGEDKADYLEGVLYLVPTADVVERKRGKWIGIPHKTISKRNRTIHSMVYICPLCRYSNGRHKSNFCPNCGADMRESEGEDGYIAVTDNDKRTYTCRG